VTASIAFTRRTCFIEIRTNVVAVETPYTRYDPDYSLIALLVEVSPEIRCSSVWSSFCCYGNSCF